MADIRIGTSAFTAEGWEGSFYPKGLPAREQLSYYATQFDAVELDNTFYRTPALSTVKGWYAKTPPGFLFAAKVPQVITHEKVLVDCDEDLSHFLKTMEALGEKLGPLLFQFGYFNKAKFASGAEFVARLKPFLKGLPKGFICGGDPEQDLAGRASRRTVRDARGAVCGDSAGARRGAGAD
jgi:uncharacterized protein YecE (DUF72 family)